MPVAFLKIAEPYFEGAGGPKALFSVPFFTKYPTVIYIFQGFTFCICYSLASPVQALRMFSDCCVSQEIYLFYDQILGSHFRYISTFLIFSEYLCYQLQYVNQYLHRGYGPASLPRQGNINFRYIISLLFPSLTIFFFL